MSDNDTSNPQLDDFLAHYGVKGMKWGVRKDRIYGGGGSGGGSGSKVKKKIASGASSVGSKVKSKFSRKKDDGSEDTSGSSGGSSSGSQDSEKEISEDVYKHVKAAQAGPNALSDKELQSLVNRANLTSQYDKMFNQGSNAALKEKLDRLQTEKSIRQLEAELNPKRTYSFDGMKATKNVATLLKTSADAYEAYSRLNALSGGTLSKKVGLPVAEITKSGKKNKGN